MGDTRFKNGIAYGPYNNFFARTDNVFSSGDTTPDVSLGSLFFTSNIAATSITDFDLSVVGPIPGASGHSNVAGQFEGKEIRVVFLDDSTTLVRSNRLIVNGDGLNLPQNSVMNFIYHNSAWYESYRSINQSNIVTVESKNLTGSVVSLGTGGVSVLGVDVVRIRAEASSAAVLRTALNGYQGQIITLVAHGASDALIIVNSASNVDGTFVSTTSGSGATQFRLMSSGAVSFVKQGNQWLELRPIWSNSSVGITQ